MIAFDTNILTEVLLGNPPFVARVAAIPGRLQSVPVIVIEEIILRIWILRKRGLWKFSRRHNTQ